MKYLIAFSFSIIAAHALAQSQISLTLPLVSPELGIEQFIDGLVINNSGSEESVKAEISLSLNQEDVAFIRSDELLLHKGNSSYSPGLNKVEYSSERFQGYLEQYHRLPPGEYQATVSLLKDDTVLTKSTQHFRLVLTQRHKAELYGEHGIILLDLTSTADSPVSYHISFARVDKPEKRLEWETGDDSLAVRKIKGLRKNQRYQWQVEKRFAGLPVSQSKRQEHILRPGKKRLKKALSEKADSTRLKPNLNAKGLIPSIKPPGIDSTDLAVGFFGDAAVEAVGSNLTYNESGRRGSYQRIYLNPGVQVGDLPVQSRMMFSSEGQQTDLSAFSLDLDFNRLIGNVGQRVKKKLDQDNQRILADAAIPTDFSYDRLDSLKQAQALLSQQFDPAELADTEKQLQALEDSSHKYQEGAARGLSEKKENARKQAEEQKNRKKPDSSGQEKEADKGKSIDSKAKDQQAKADKIKAEQQARQAKVEKQRNALEAKRDKLQKQEEELARLSERAKKYEEASERLQNLEALGIKKEDYDPSSLSDPDFLRSQASEAGVSQLGKLALGLRRFGLGIVNPDFNEHILQAAPLLGANAELSLNRYYINVAAGNTFSGRLDQSIFAPGAFQYRVLGAKAGLGAPERTHAHIVFQRSSRINDSRGLREPAENLLLGADLRLNLGKAVYTGILLTQSSSVYSTPTDANIYDLAVNRLSLSRDISMAKKYYLGGYIAATSTTWEVEYFKVGPAYINPTNVFLRHDNEGAAARVTQELFSNTLTVKGELSSMRDNLEGHKSQSARLLSYKLDGRTRFKKLPNLNLGYQKNEHQVGGQSQTGFGSAHTTEIWNGGVSYQRKIGSVLSMSQLQQMQLRASSNSELSDNTNQSTQIEQLIQFRSGSQLSFGYLEVRSQYGRSLQLSRAIRAGYRKAWLRNRLSTGLTLSYQRSQPDIWQARAALQLGYKATKQLSLQLTGGHAQLSPTARVSQTQEWLIKARLGYRFLNQKT